MTRLIAITLLLVGCGTQPQAGNDGTPATGIYRLDVAPATGDCQPPILSGPLANTPQMYVGTWDHLQLRMPEDSRDQAFRTLMLVNGDSDNQERTCGASHEMRLSVAAQSGSGLDVTRIDVWSDVGAAVRGAPGCDIVPSADCTSSVEMRYTLETACPPPRCTVKEGQPSAPNLIAPLDCVCADGGAP
jgi:hypothetical protein